MQMGKLKIALLILGGAALAFEVWHLHGRGWAGPQQTTRVAPKHEPDFALLPSSQIAVYAGRFANPKPSLENWEPTVADINDLEANLSQVSALSNKEPESYRHLDNPRQYFRQYLAVVVNGKKTLFVNALCRVEPNEDWRKRLILVTDGGNCYWNAVYDPAAHTFSHLAVNGRA